MDRVRDACPTGTMMEVDNRLSPYPHIESKSMCRSTHKLMDVPGDGDCLYHSLAKLYNFTVGWPTGVKLCHRMQAVTKQYSPGTTFMPTARFLRMLFLDFLHKHWDHYYNQRAFRDSLLKVAKKEMASLQNGSKPTSKEVQKAYIRRMGQVRMARCLTTERMLECDRRLEWGGPVECDIASELFGIRITLWVDLQSEPRYYWRNNVFLPEILAGSVSRDMSMWEWNLVQTGMAHFKYLMPRVPASQLVPPTPLPAPPVVQPRRVNWADEVDKVQPGAMAKIRKLISSRLPYTWEEFKAWFDLNFSTIGVAGRLAAINLFFAVYQHFMTATEEAAAAAEDQGQAPSQLPPFTPFMQGPSMGRSVVDEVFSKHLRAAPP